jgi:hypothetical protein
VAQCRLTGREPVAPNDHLTRPPGHFLRFGPLALDGLLELNQKNIDPPLISRPDLRVIA